MTTSEARKKSANRGDVLCSNFVRKEKSRYERKGYGLLVSMFIAAIFFLGVPALGRVVWPHLLECQAFYNLSDTAILLVVITSLHNSINLTANLIYWGFYHFEIPFIERYKSNDQPWPWNADRQKWNSLLGKSIAVLIFNSNVLSPAVYLILDRF